MSWAAWGISFECSTSLATRRARIDMREGIGGRIMLPAEGRRSTPSRQTACAALGRYACFCANPPRGWLLSMLVLLKALSLLIASLTDQKRGVTGKAPWLILDGRRGERALEMGPPFTS